MKNKVMLFEEFAYFLNENTQNVYDKILANNSLSTFLNYLVHDKAHVMDNKSSSLELEKILALVKGQKYNKPLYRGLYTENIEDFLIGEVYQFPRYQSFSEDLEIAKQFSQKGLILQANTSVDGFNYGGYQVSGFEKLKKDDPESYEMEDGDFMIERALEEAAENISMEYVDKDGDEDPHGDEHYDQLVDTFKQYTTNESYNLNEAKDWYDYTPEKIAKSFMRDSGKDADAASLDSWLDMFSQDKRIEDGTPRDVLEDIIDILNKKGYKLDAEDVAAESPWKYSTM